jgi:hypothetical protein
MVGADPHVAWAELQRVMSDGTGVPGEWRAAARTAFRWLTTEAECAERVYDATSMNGAYRSGGAMTRQVRFATPQEDLDLVLDSKGDEIMLRGQLLSGCPAKVTVRWPGGELATTTDERGAFRLHELPRVPFYVLVDGSAAVKTPWLLP